MDTEATGTPYTDEWWLERLSKQLVVQARRSQLMWDRYAGEPPLPTVHPNVAPVVRAFLRKARTRFERLIVAGPLSRMKIVGIRTAVDSDADGDAGAFGVWSAANMKLVTREVHKMMFAMGLAYVIVGRDTAGGLLVTAEDPRNVTAIVDPANPYRVLAALKLVHDDIAGEDVAYLYMDGRVRVAYRARKARAAVSGSVAVSYSSSLFEWDDADTYDAEGRIIRHSRSGAIDGITGNPVTPFANEDGLAEFEPHLDILDRITDQLVQRMAIVLAQAFKQRAIKGDLPVVDPDTGRAIDYNDLFRADPMSVWLLPAGAEMWESGEASLQAVLLAVRDDIKDLAAVSSTPLYSITPDAANGSAEGASLQREGLTFKTEAHIERVDPAWERVAAQILTIAGQGASADRTKLDVIWAPAERFSLSERASAVAQTKGVVPRRTQLTDIMGYSPTDADRMMDELTDDMVLDQQMAAARGGNAVAG